MTYRVTPRGMQDTVGLISDPVLDNAREDEIDDEGDRRKDGGDDGGQYGRQEPRTGVGCNLAGPRSTPFPDEERGDKGDEREDTV